MDGINVETCYRTRPRGSSASRWAVFLIKTSQHGFFVQCFVEETVQAPDRRYLPDIRTVASESFFFSREIHSKTTIVAEAFANGDLRGKYADTVFHGLVFPVYVSDFYATWFPEDAAFYRKHWDEWRLGESWILEIPPAAVKYARDVLAEQSGPGMSREREIAAALIGVVEAAPKWKLEPVGDKGPETP